MFPWMIWCHGNLEEMAKWPVTEAKIIAADTTWTYHRYRGVRYRHNLAYGFFVKGRPYAGHCISYGASPAEWRTEAEARRALPEIGSKVQIRFDPRNPDDSVIYVVQMSDFEEFLMLCFSGGVGAVGGVLMIGAGKAWRSERR